MEFNMTETRHTMSVQDPHERIHNFSEVALGYEEETAREEARRCIRCKQKPCTEGCPVGVDIPAMLALVAEGKYEEAYAVLHRTNALPAATGRVCPQERQCEARCTRGKRGEPVAIGRIERFVADWHREHASRPSSPPSPLTGRSAAVVGSGPAGLACAGELAAHGFRVTVFEALHLAGGVLMYGIPEFRLPKEIVRQEIASLEEAGVTFVTNAVVGRALSVEELLQEGYDAVFLGTGAGLPQFMNIPGENAVGVFSANEFLTRVNLMKAYEADSETPLYPAKKVAVVGGGNVAMDAARCARRLGAEVTVVYRRSEAELPARREEVLHAKEEGVLFRFLTNPTRVLTQDGKAVGLRCAEMELGEPDASGRRRPVPKEGCEWEMDADCVIMALGTSPNPLLRETTALQTGARGEILTDADGRTSLRGVYAGGDAVTGSATVILAMGAGRRAAQAIIRDLNGS